jgi:DNA invertase Pin-like site-specific DNA recombinase
VKPERIYIDHGLTGTHRDRPGLLQGLPACRTGDTLVVTKLDRLARSLPDARDRRRAHPPPGEARARHLRARSERTGWAAVVQRTAMVAEFEADPMLARTREGMKGAKAKGRLRGKQPKLSPMQEAHLVALYRAGEHTVSELEELFGVTRSTTYRAMRRAGGRAAGATRPRRRSANRRRAHGCSRT